MDRGDDGTPHSGWNCRGGLGATIGLVGETTKGFGAETRNLISSIVAVKQRFVRRLLAGADAASTRNRDNEGKHQWAYLCRLTSDKRPLEQSGAQR
jgi:hypothetical protein